MAILPMTGADCAVNRCRRVFDPNFYHNRGNSTCAGESAELGDFAGSADPMTENPRVREGLSDIYGAWIDRFAVDGFSIDTARPVNSEFLQRQLAPLRRSVAPLDYLICESRV